MDTWHRREGGWVDDIRQRALLTGWGQVSSASRVSSGPIISFHPWSPSSEVGIIVLALLTSGVAVHAMSKYDNHTEQHDNYNSQDKEKLVCDSEKTQ